MLPHRVSLAEEVWGSGWDKIYLFLLFQKQSFLVVVDQWHQNAHVQWSTLAAVYLEGLRGSMMLEKCILPWSIVAELWKKELPQYLDMLELLGSSRHHIACLCLVGSLHFAGRLTSILQLVWMVGCCLQYFPNIKKVQCSYNCWYRTIHGIAFCCSNCRALSHAKYSPLYNCFPLKSPLIHTLNYSFCSTGGYVKQEGIVEGLLWKRQDQGMPYLLHKQMHDRSSIAESLHAYI